MRREAIYYGPSESLQSKDRSMQKLRKTSLYARMCRMKTTETSKNNSANRKITAIRTK